MFILFSECPVGDEICEKDRIGFEAIRHLHRQIDDDQNGNLDRSESDEVGHGTDGKKRKGLVRERRGRPLDGWEEEGGVGQRATG